MQEQTLSTQRCWVASFCQADIDRGNGNLCGFPTVWWCRRWVLCWLSMVAIRLTGSRKWGRRIMGSTGKVISQMCFYNHRLTSVFALAVGLFVVKFFSDWSQPTVWGTCTDIGVHVRPLSLASSILQELFLFPFPNRTAARQVHFLGGRQEFRKKYKYNPMFALVAGLYFLTAFVDHRLHKTHRAEDE